MKVDQEWETAFSIYEQGMAIEPARKNLESMPELRAQILANVKQGIRALVRAGFYGMANRGKKLYNDISGTNAYPLEAFMSKDKILDTTSRGIFHVYARHAEDYGDGLTAVGAIQSVGLAEQMKSIYEGRNPRLFVSEASRASYTAEPIASELGIQIERRPELNEQSTTAREFVGSINEDAIFITHKPRLVEILGRELGHAQYNVIKRLIK